MSSSIGCNSIIWQSEIIQENSLVSLSFSITYLNDILGSMKLDFLTKRKQILDVQVSIVVS